MGNEDNKPLVLDETLFERADAYGLIVSKGKPLALSTARIPPGETAALSVQPILSGWMREVQLKVDGPADRCPVISVSSSGPNLPGGLILAVETITVLVRNNDPMRTAEVSGVVLFDELNPYTAQRIIEEVLLQAIALGPGALSGS